jgi:DNA mismatch repair protein MutS2
MALLNADERLAEAELATRLKASKPNLDDKINLKNIRHPLLTLNGTPVVPNSIELGTEHRLLLLSGPNAGGKTVLLKSVGLAAQMVKCGLPICADEGSRIPFFRELIVALGDSQSVDANLSTFAAHLKTLEQAAQSKGTESLILIDEICGSTDPEEGAALARSFLDEYCANQVFGVVTSHLGALKSGWQDGSGVINGSLEFDAKRGPTYRFIMGLPGQSLAIQTAQRVGVPKAIVERALHYLSPERRKYEETLSEVERMKKDILRIQDDLQKERRASIDAKEKYEDLVQKFEAEREQKLERELRAAQRKVEDLIQETKAQEVFRRHESLQKIKFELPNVIKATPANMGGSGSMARAQAAEPLSAEDFGQIYKPGTAIHITSLGRDGIIQGAPNARGEVPVLSNSMRLMIDWRDLKPTSQQGVALTARLKRVTASKFSNVETDRVVDVRGLTAEEAISQIEIQLDTAAVGGEDRVKVVHGHGTDTLKRAVRSYLSRSVYVKKWQAGNADTGGDGVTWVELKG